MYTKNVTENLISTAQLVFLKADLKMGPWSSLSELFLDLKEQVTLKEEPFYGLGFLYQI